MPIPDDNGDGISILTDRRAIRSWYRPDSKAKQKDIAQEAYDDAKKFVETELRNNGKAKDILQGSSGMNDVLDVVEKVKKRYEKDTAENAAVLNWLDRFSGTILYYSNILDILAQHHPEYLCLAWGSVKFVLLGILNYSELVVEFAEALANIGDALRQTKLSAELFKTDEMQGALTHLYAHIILFLQQAVEWYNKGRAGRAFSAVFKPYKLKYKDTVDQIKLCTKLVNDVASAASRAEVRDIHIVIQLMRGEIKRRDEELHKMQLELKERQARIENTVSDVLQVATSNKTITESIHFNVMDIKPRIYEIEFSQILSVLKPRTSPDEMLNKVLSISRRSQSQRTRAKELTSLLGALGAWISVEGSSLFFVKVGPRAEAQAKEFAADVIKFLRGKSIHVIWNISPLKSDNGLSSLAEVLRGLVFQLLRQNSGLLDNHLQELNFAKFAADHTDTEWGDLLCKILSRLSNCFVVVEAQDLFEANKDEMWATRFLQLFQGIVNQAARTGNSLKILVLGYGTTFSFRDTECENQISSAIQRPVITPVCSRRPANWAKRNDGWRRLQARF